MTRANQRQRAKAGDLIVIEGNHVGDTKRTGEIVEVLGDPGHEHYRVRWDDRESIFYPGGGEATIKHQTGRR